jgi:hypothetical protein
MLKRSCGVFQEADFGRYKHLAAYFQLWLTHVLKILLHKTNLLKEILIRSSGHTHYGGSEGLIISLRKHKDTGRPERKFI